MSKVNRQPFRRWNWPWSFFNFSRIYDEKTNSHTWDRVTKLEKGVIYYEGTSKILQDLTGWKGHQILYFGDHLYSDLADVTLEHGWRTGAIINELSVNFNSIHIPYIFLDFYFSYFLLKYLLSMKLKLWTTKNSKKLQTGSRCWLL